MDLRRRWHGAGRHRGGADIADRARRQGAGAGVRSIRASAGRDRAAGSRPTSSTIETEWGTVFDPATIRSRLPSSASGRSSSPPARATPRRRSCSPLRRDRRALPADTTRCSMSTARRRWRAIRSRRTLGQIDIASAGLQKCLSGPSGSAPITFNQRAADVINARKHYEAGIKPAGAIDGNGPIIQSNYFDLGHADGLLEPEAAQPPHRGGFDAVRGARMRPRRAGGRARRRHRAAPPCVIGIARRSRGNGARAFRRRPAPHGQRHRRRHPEGDCATPTSCAPRCSPTSASRSAPRSGRCTAGSGASAPWAMSAAARTCCGVWPRSSRRCAATA